MKPTQRPARWIWLFIFLPLSGCELVQNLPYVGKALPEPESKAIGAGCRHAGRAIEDCFAINPRASRSGIFTGWREMNDYMTTGKIGEVKPLVAANTPPPPEPVAKDDHDTGHEDEDADADHGKKKTVAHADDKHDAHDEAPAKGGAKGGEKVAGKSAGKESSKSAAKGSDHGDEKTAEKKSADKPEKASAKYVTSADRPPPESKTSPRPRWEPGKKEKEGEDSPKVWERKPRT